jgi:hypothetical protein
MKSRKSNLMVYKNSPGCHNTASDVGLQKKTFELHKKQCSKLKNPFESKLSLKISAESFRNKSKNCRSENVLSFDKPVRLNTNINMNLKLRIDSKNFITKKLSKKTAHDKDTSLNAHIESNKFLKLTHNSPVKNRLYLKLQKDAIQRPYNPEESTPIAYKEFSISTRNRYWRKKKLEQYKISKNKDLCETLTPNINKDPKKKKLNKKNRSVEQGVSLYISTKQSNESTDSLNITNINHITSYVNLK